MVLAERRVRRRPPRTLWLARAARWPRPLALTLLAAVLVLGAAVWRPLLWGAVACWALTAAAATLDGRLRGRVGLLAGAAAALLGPLAAALAALAHRRDVRKVGVRYRGALPPAVLLAALGALVALTLGRWALDRLAFTVPLPTASMAPRLAKGDRVVVSPLLLRTPERGELVALEAFPAARLPVHAGARVGTVLRIVALGPEWVGATGQGLYRCTRQPDIAKPLTAALGCVFPDESAYVVHRTKPFGPVPIPRGSVFLLGDDRTQSRDSRDFGPVPEARITGRVVATVWPLRRLSVR